MGPMVVAHERSARQDEAPARASLSMALGEAARTCTPGRPGISPVGGGVMGARHVTSRSLRPVVGIASRGPPGPRAAERRVVDTEFGSVVGAPSWPLCRARVPRRNHGQAGRDAHRALHPQSWASPSRSWAWSVGWQRPTMGSGHTRSSGGARPAPASAAPRHRTLDTARGPAGAVGPAGKRGRLGCDTVGLGRPPCAPGPVSPVVGSRRPVLAVEPGGRRTVDGR